jgi:hypothetical protein
VAEGQWPAIISRETHLRLKVKLGDPKRGPGTKTGRKPMTLLTGIAKCAGCQDTIRAGSDRGVKTYVCAKHGHVIVPRAQADEWVHAWMIATLESRDVLSLLLPSGDEDVDKAKLERETLQGRLDTLSEMFALGKLTESQLDSGTAMIMSELESLDEMLDGVAGVDLLADLSVGTDAVAEQWLDLNLERQRAILGLLTRVEIRQTASARGKKSTAPIDERVVVLDRA